MTVSGGRSRKRVVSCICVTPSEARAPLAMIRGCQPKCGRYLANLRERWTPAPPRGGKRYDRYNNERVNSTAPEACAEATPSLFDGFARRPVGCAKAVPEEWMRSVGWNRGHVRLRRSEIYLGRIMMPAVGGDLSFLCFLWCL